MAVTSAQRGVRFPGVSSVVQRGEAWVGGDIQLGDGMSVAWDGSGGKENCEKEGMGQLCMSNSGNPAGKKMRGSG